jgi:hypothetical protein
LSGELKNCVIKRINDNKIYFQDEGTKTLAYASIQNFLIIPGAPIPSIKEVYRVNPFENYVVVSCHNSNDLNVVDITTMKPVLQIQNLNKNKLKNDLAIEDCLYIYDGNKYKYRQISLWGLLPYTIPKSLVLIENLYSVLDLSAKKITYYQDGNEINDQKPVSFIKIRTRFEGVTDLEVKKLF